MKKILVFRGCNTDKYASIDATYTGMGVRPFLYQRKQRLMECSDTHRHGH
jgi:hypothetical protein